MCTINMTFEVPDSRAIDIEALKSQLNDIFHDLVSRSAFKKDAIKYDANIFDCFSGDFGGDRDAHEIADELHDSRVFTRNVTALS